MTSTKPLYLLAGGHWRRPSSLVPLLEAVLAETGEERPTVAYVGAASGDNRVFLAAMRRLLAAAGAAKVVPVRLAREDADRRAAEAALGDAHAIFISGGDVEEGMRWLERHAVAPLLRARYEAGATLFGVSAGSIMLGARWVRWRDPDADDTAELFDCLGLAPLVCDTHGEADDWAELKAAVRLMGRRGSGYGIPAGGALRIGTRGEVAALVKPAARYAVRDGAVTRDGDVPVED